MVGGVGRGVGVGVACWSCRVVGELCHGEDGYCVDCMGSVKGMTVVEKSSGDFEGQSRRKTVI